MKKKGKRRKKLRGSRKFKITICPLLWLIKTVSMRISLAMIRSKWQSVKNLRSFAIWWRITSQFQRLLLSKMRMESNKSMKCLKNRKRRILICRSACESREEVTLAHDAPESKSRRMALTPTKA